MTSSGKTEAFEYWVHEAHKKSEAKELAARLKLDMPRGKMYGFKAGLLYPIRRLVVTGEDTKENFALLFGPSWEGMIDVHNEQRTQVLLAPSPEEGSPMHMMSGIMDEGCPKWNPRPASEAEKRHIDQFQEIFRRNKAILADITRSE